MKIKSDERFFEAPELHSNSTPVLPERIVNAIQEAVTPDTLLTLDAGNNRLWMTRYFKSLKAGTIFCPGGLAGMAWGPPAAITAKLLNPDKPVVSVSGDGGFAMAAHVLSTAVQHKLPITFVVMNNSLLGMVYDGQVGRPVATEFIDTDFSIIAQGIGARGVRIKWPEERTASVRSARTTRWIS